MMADDTVAGSPSENTQSPAERAGTLEHEIEDIRANLDRMLGDLDRRRHEAFDVGLQWHRHKVGIIGIGASVLAIVGGFIAFGVHRRRQRARLNSPKRRFSRALANIGRAPERATSRGKTILGRIASAGGGAAAAAIARQMASRLSRR
jgi:hypothetical protein